ncbi:MAG: NADH-quinone oxidoreductase subunit L, partial [Verrucomicrobiales bacterium]|nr:NADH-quinone oxidoreductase subunit L [Verrucomicrobiales bacterium]
MSSFVQYLWLIPLLPLVAAGINAVLPTDARRAAMGLTIATMAASFLISVVAFFKVADGGRLCHNFDWFSLGGGHVRLGWLLDPLSAAMLMMVTFVGTCIFVYSVAYMAHDARQKQFFTFLSLFAAAMLGLIISNSLLLLFMCWEVVGLASYLLIGFWFEKPSAAAACKKAFITTRIGDIGFLLGIVWLAKENGALLFFDNGAGFLEQGALEHLNGLAVGGISAATAIGLLLFCGAMGKSGQVPL